MNEYHVTDISVFTSDCRRKYDYKVNQKLKRNKPDVGALWFGTNMHKVWAVFYNDGGIVGSHTNNTLKTVWNNILAEEFCDAETANKRAEFTPLAHSMIDIYYDFAYDNDKDYEVVDVEKEIIVPIELLNGNVVNLIATLDVIVRHKPSGNMFVVDHKHLADFKDLEDLELDFQMSAYLYASNVAGINTLAALYNMMRKKIPAEPIVLQNGDLSIDKGIDTTYSKYALKAKELCIDLSEPRYKNIIEKIKANPFIMRERVFRTKRFLTNFEHQLKCKLTDMDSNPYIYPCENKNCTKFCQYKMLCKAENDGGDVDLIKRTEYYVDETGGR